MLWESSRNNINEMKYAPETPRSVITPYVSTSVQSKIHKLDRYGMPEDELMHTVTINHKKTKSSAWSIDKSLTHYGVPGMHWGEITKEYVPTGTYKRRAITPAQYQKKKKASASSTLSKEANSFGQYVGNAFFQAARNRKKQEEKEAYEKAHPEEKKPDLVDKGVNKVFDHFGLSAYSQMASQFIKDKAKDMALDMLRKKAESSGGNPIKIGGKYAGAIGQVIATPVSLAGKAAIKGAEHIGPLAKKGIKTFGKGLKAVGKVTGKGLVKAGKWYTSHRSQINNVLNTGKTYITKLVNKSSVVTNLGRSFVQSGAKIAQKGALGLVKLLSKIRR